MRALNLNVLGLSIAVTTDATRPMEEIRAVFGRYEVDVLPRNVIEINFVWRQSTWEIEIDGRIDRFSFRDPWPNFGTLIQLLLVCRRSDLTFLHASAARIPSGTVLFLGPSSHGKTTLACALAKDGGELTSDDLSPVVLERRSILPLLKSVADFPLPKSSERKISHIFFLDAPRGVPEEERDISHAFVEWDRLCDLVVGRRIERRMGGSCLLRRFGRSSFAGMPAVRPLTQCEALRKLVLFIHPPHATLAGMLSPLSEFLNSVEAFALTPGTLAPTLELVKKVSGTARQERLYSGCCI